MSYIPPEQGSVRDRQNFDYDNEMLAGRGIASLLTKYPEVWVRKGLRGYHVVVDSEPDLIERYTIGDCWGRFNADLKRKKRGQPLADRTGILFYYKNKKFKTRWVRVRAIDFTALLVDLELRRAEIFEKCMEART